MSPIRSEARSARSMWALPVDAVAVIVFAMLGRGAHSREPGIAGIIHTAWPFLVALGVCWVAWLILANDSAVAVRVGVYFWLGTLIGGMAIWGLRAGKVPHWSFLIVAGITTAIVLIGWRALAIAISRRKQQAHA